MRYFLSFPLILTCLLSQAQVTNDPTLMTLNQGYYGYMRTFAPDPTIEGEYFYQEEDFSLTLHLKDTKSPYEAEAANINLLDQSIVLDLGKGKYAILPENIDSASFTSGGAVINSSLINDYPEPNLLLFVMHRGQKVTALKAIDAFVVDPTYNEATNTGNRNYTIKMKTNYHLMLADGKLLPFGKLKELKVLGNYGEVKQYVKTERLNLKEEDDLIKLSGYLDSVL